MFLNGMRGGGVLACLVCGAAAIIACGPERRASEDEAADEPEVPWLMGVFTRQTVGTSFSERFSNQYEFREGGEGVVWQNGMHCASSGRANMKWVAQSATRVRVDPLDGPDGPSVTPFIVAPTSNCNELRSGTVRNTIEPSGAELLTPLVSW